MDNNIQLFIWVEPHFALTPWYRNLYDGLKSALYSKRIKSNIELINEVTGNMLPYNSVVILAGETDEWYNRMLAYISSRQSHSCVLACDPCSSFDASFISTDYKKDMKNMVQYLVSIKHQHIALFGINPSSPHDQMRIDGYLQTVQACELPLSEEDIFYMSGDVSDCANSLLKVIGTYDAVIAGNDLYAIYLLSRLEANGFSVPSDLYLAAFGNTLLSSISKPSITTTTINMFDIGREAIYYSLHMLKTPPITRFTVFLEGKIYPRQSTENKTFKKQPELGCLTKPNYVNISSYTDSSLLTIVKLEMTLIENNNIDLSIIKGLSMNQPLPEMLEALFVSESTLDYHLSKLYHHFGVKSRQALVSLLIDFSKYIDFSIL